MHVCLFDIDGTLIDTGGAGSAAMYRALQTEFGVASVPVRVPFLGRTDRAIVRDLFAACSIADSIENWHRFLAAYLVHLPATLAERTGRVLPGVSELLDQLADRPRVALGLLTGNVRDGAYTKLAHYGLASYFRFGAFGDVHFARTQVAGEALEQVRRHVDGTARREHIWVVGDTTLDVQCARCIGVQAVAVATGGHSIQRLAAAGPDLLLPDLTHAAPLLAELNRQEP